MSTENQNITAGSRLLSIDALRGFDMFWITGGALILRALAKSWENPVTLEIQNQVRHVKWQGVHFYDLIYPLFLFIIGVVLPFSFASRLRRGQSYPKIYLHILTRSIILVILGYITYGLLRFKHLPTMGGVLQHIGLCYFFASLIILHTNWRTQAVIVPSYLIVYWLASILIPVPGFGAGVFTEQASLSSYIDGWFISGPLWNEGPASTPSGICIIIWGALAGHWLRTNYSGNRKAATLVLAGIAALALGGLWSFSFPIIKRIIWSSSYVTFACGWSMLLLGIFYWLIDVRGYKKWSFFFVVIGTNAIAAYVAASLFDFKLIGNIFIGGLSRWLGQWNDFIQAIAAFVVLWLILLWMYRKKSFIKI